MSITDSLSPRLRWYNGKGLAAGSGAIMTMSQPPHLAFEFAELDYCPGVCMQVRTHPWQALRDMLPAEIDECARFLRSLEQVPDVEGDV